MDKTLQIVVVAAVIMMAAAIIMFLLTGKVGGIGKLVDDKTHGASCSINKTRYIEACNCSAEPAQPLPPAGSIKSNSNCGWTSGDCETLCS